MEEKFKEIKKDFNDILEHYGEDVEELTVDNSFLKEFSSILNFCESLMYEKRYLENKVNDYRIINKEYKDIIAMFINNKNI